MARKNRSRVLSAGTAACSSPLLKKAKPVLKVLPGFKKDIRGITRFEDLPKEAQEYVLFIEKEIGAPITMVSTGPKREEIIHRA